MDERLKDLFKSAVKNGQVPGIGAFVVDETGCFIFKETFGSTQIDDPDAPVFGTDTVLQIFSCTKLLTTIAALQLIEQGKLSASDHVERYVPAMSRTQVLDHSAHEGEEGSVPSLRPPKSKPTILQLMNHTAGFSYDFLDGPTLAWRTSTGRQPVQYYTVGDWADFEYPLVADPGTKYTYGISTDWLGFVVEAVSKMPLPEYINSQILVPLEMKDTAAAPRTGRAKLIVHYDMDDRLVADPSLKNAEEPEMFGGGASIYSTLNDYAKLLATLLNEGTSPATGRTILAKETVKDYLFTDLLPLEVDKSGLGRFHPTIPILSREGTLLPSLPTDARGCSAGLMLNHIDMPHGRKAGSASWCGLGNLYYWIDPSSKRAGMVGTSVLPFLNPTVLHLFDEVERAAYDHKVSGDQEESKGGNVVMIENVVAKPG
ncbi:hypothetical protein H2204_012229 [Knufia peltigerae]|uniref:Beta-lactamase-related domain-containing protein n=1 Tax=Knufia peltigerae TaxID=1002370 RepID=A0AA38XSW0_9EURO|nr:hypothetical protein H2204_012229 [Knufia peltigerae]